MAMKRRALIRQPVVRRTDRVRTAAVTRRPPVKPARLVSRAVRLEMVEVMEALPAFATHPAPATSTSASSTSASSAPRRVTPVPPLPRALTIAAPALAHNPRRPASEPPGSLEAAHAAGAPGASGASGACAGLRDSLSPTKPLQGGHLSLEAARSAAEPTSASQALATSLATSKARALRLVSGLSGAIWRRRVALVIWGASVAVALVAPLVLEALGITQQIDQQMSTLGFDAERARLITAFAVTLLSAAIAGLLTLHRGAAWSGGLLYFVTNELWPFYQQAQHPLLGPDGRPLTVLAGSLTHVTLTLFALGVLFAAAGAVLGEACGRVVVPPLLALGTYLARLTLRLARPVGESGRTAHGLAFPAAARPLVVGVLVLGAVALGMPSFGTILSFGASTDLYQPAQALVPNDQGSVEQGTYVSSALGGAARAFSIYLPPSYFTLDAQTRRYPVLYLLHGSPGGPTDWFAAGHADQTLDALTAAGLTQETIVVSPDGNGSIYPVSAWVNSFDKRQRMEDAIATDLVAYIDSHYRTLPKAPNRVIGGLSEGGFGAVNIGLHRPDVFSRVMCLSGFFAADGNAVFGRGQESIGYRRYNSPTVYLQTLEGQKAGHQLMFVIGLGKLDGRYYRDGLAFAKELDTYGIKVHVVQNDGGHSWLLWGQMLGQSLPLLAPKAPGRPCGVSRFCERST
jgi:enterochelin esterase-like enzyme